ncbi:flagellar export chaperone FliS [Paenibacillus beijingensis]|uniref:Flagellar secretion chaperone FliS n=1 Tax=Paenibacillus beijingensis TaxID=1126833 RepID=A0A0D5NH94_9BACL|nr:flagellar export chaperone FliS [Paenibacillus beijingensis]AJY74510.1 flagellar biosynthesis protein FliS [Paenibacillus beijingensis]
MIQSPYQKYQQLSAQTATPIQLVLMLYDGAIRFTKQGISGIETKQYEHANEYLCKAESVIHELTAALDFNYPISKDLARIYEYLLYQLIQANIKKEARIATEVLGLLQELRDAWKQISKTAVPASP